MTKLKKSDEGIYFLSLSLENVRCFAAKQTLDLSDGNGRPAQWTVILGDNGTGKTTLLEVLEKHNMMNFGSEIYNLPRNSSSHFRVEFCYAFNNILNNKDKGFNRYSCRVEPRNDGTPNYRCVSELSISDNSCHLFDSHKLKISAYRATRKLRKYRTDELLDSYDELINAEEWLLQTDYIANKKSKIQDSYKERFKIIKDVLINLLPDVEDIRISEPTEQLPNPRVEFKTSDGWLMLFKLSLGYQTMTAWMVDLTARLFDCYPDSPNPIAEPAVVLIDEIDLHLHPKWQRTIMSYLSERFVNTQFIVTAHSPLIVQAAEDANIVVLKREGDGVVIHQQDRYVQGWRIDQLLTSDLFDLKSARSPHYERLLDQRRQLLSKANLSEQDHAQLKTLEAQIGGLPTAETAGDIQAMDIIRRAAQLLKQA